MKIVKWEKIKGIVIYTMLFFTLIFYLFPLYWLTITSFKTPSEVFTSPPVWVPSKLIPDNYLLILGYVRGIWAEAGAIYRYQSIIPFLLNSTIVSFLTTMISVFLGALLAYSIARLKFGGKNLFTWLLGLRMIPPAVIVIPIFIIFYYMKLVNTWWALIIAYLITNIPFATLVLVGFFNDIPKELDEAALIDGCNRVNSFLKIVLPLSLPGLVAASIICFITCWNELLLATALTTTQVAQTLPVYTTVFTSQVERGTTWGPAAAGGVIAIIPMIIFSFYIQRYLVKGLTMGAIRG
ncbi:MAG: carbohydrate ABC transporter permease [Candidatus Aenigmatarchaeota archaeon]